MVSGTTPGNPESAIDSLMKRNPIAKRDVELERLKLSLAKNYVTPDVTRRAGRHEAPSIVTDIEMRVRAQPAALARIHFNCGHVMYPVRADRRALPES